MNLFDFHYHAYIKPLASGYPAVKKFRNRRNPWRFEKPRISSFEVRLLPKAHFEKLNKFQGSVHISALLSVDYPMICSKTFDLADILGATQSTTLHKMRTNEPIQNLSTEFLVMDAANQNIPEIRQNVHFVKNGDIQPGKINVLFSVEGLHSIFKLKRVDMVTRDGRGYFQDFNQFELDYAFFRALKQSTLGRVLYITITHLAYWPVCTHAFGLHPFVSQEDNYITDFIRPRGFGYADPAFFQGLMDQCFSESYKDPITQQQVNGKKILLDVKHSSLVSRLQFYAFRQKWLQEQHQHSKDFPILASHMGVTGISYRKIKESLLGEDQVDPGCPDCRVVAYSQKKSKGKFGIEFNPSSINLYDEDIQEIVDSGGFIGISADRRILGADEPLRRFWKFGKDQWKNHWTFKKIKEFEIFSTEELKHIYASAQNNLDWLALTDPNQRLAQDIQTLRAGINQEALIPNDRSGEGNDDDINRKLTTQEINKITKEKQLIFGKSKFEKAVQYTTRTSEAIKRDLRNQVNAGMAPSEAALRLHLEDDTDISPKRIKEMEEMYGLEFEGLEYFVNNIVHIIRVAGAEAWNHICFGSDYDGFIDPIDALLTIDKMHAPLFRFKLELLLAAWTKKEDLFIRDHRDLVRKVSNILVGNGVSLVQRFA